MKGIYNVVKIIVVVLLVTGLGLLALHYYRPELKNQLVETKEQVEVATIANKLFKAETVEEFEKVIQDNNKIIDRLVEDNQISDEHLHVLGSFLDHSKQTGGDFKEEKLSLLLSQIKDVVTEDDYRRVEEIVGEGKLNLVDLQELYLIWKKY